VHLVVFTGETAEMSYQNVCNWLNDMAKRAGVWEHRFYHQGKPVPGYYHRLCIMQVSKIFRILENGVCHEWKKRLQEENSSLGLLLEFYDDAYYLHQKATWENGAQVMAYSIGPFRVDLFSSESFLFS